MIVKFKKVLVSFLSLAMIFTSLAPALAAQEPTGAIEGLITDPQGAIVANAEVTARNVSTNLSRTTNTGSDGRYRIGQLPPGRYELRVSYKGFKSSVVTDVEVLVGANLPLDLALEVGGATETVTVAGGGEAQIDRTDNTVSGVVGTVQIENLPLNGRNFLDLAQLQPGTETVAGGSFDPTKANYTGVSIGGQAGRSTQITVDGGSVVDNVVGTTTQNFSQEIVQEFQVGISNFDLSTGASASGAVNIISKSGSNNFHGNAYVYWRDEKFAAFPALSRLDAANGVDPAARTDEIPFDREQLGATFGGPIKRDKLFFFANAEYNNQDAVALHILPSYAPGFSGFTGNPFNELLLTGKVDWVVNDKTSMLFRYSHNHNDQQVPFSPGSGIVPRDSASGIFTSNDQIVENRSDGFVIGITRSLTSNLVNDLRYNFNDFHNFVGAATENTPELRIFNSATDQQFRTGTNSIAPQVTDQSRNQIRDDLTWTRGAHTVRLGGNWERTSITGTFVFSNPVRIRIFGPASGGPAVLQTEEQFLDAPVRDLSYGIGDATLPFNTEEDATINHRFQFYGNDSWKVTNNFTLNYGVAYRIDSNLWNHDLRRPASIAPLFTGGTEAPGRDTNNIAPRIGFAWDLTGKGRTVVRGGFGMYYDTTIDNLRLFERADLGPPGAQLFLVGFDVASDLLPGGDGRFGTSPTGATGFLTLRDALALSPAVRADLERTFSQCTLPTSIECGMLRGISPSGPIFSTDFEVPYSLQYSIGIQKELPANMVFQADFNYRKGVHELLTYDANFNDSVDAQGNPTPVLDIGVSVPYADSSAFSTYKALLLRLDRRFSNGFQLTGSYSLSRLKAFGNDALGLADGIVTDRNNFRADFGPAGLDRTHRLVVSGLWALPFFQDSTGFKKALLADWTVSFISTAFSGLPQSAQLPDDIDINGSGAFFSYLPGTGNGSIGRDIRSVSELNALIRDYNANRARFAARIEDGVPVDPQGTPLLELAELPEGTRLGGDSVISQDIRLTKAFRMGESRRLDLIAEVFNVFNVANLTDVNDTVIPTREASSEGGFVFNSFRPTARTNSVFGTGGPRAFQFALKFTF